MPNNFFQFKQFKVFQDQCAMKVGTDGVVLGLLANLTDAKSILDIGTGTGLIALMLAQRYPSAQIDALEIDAKAAAQAQKNADASPWRIHVYAQSLQEFTEKEGSKLPADGYQLIVSNPPYFNQSLKTPNKQRNLARHTDALSYEELILNAYQLLSDQGKFMVILPFEEGDNFWNFAKHHGLYLSERHSIIPCTGKDPIRVVMGFVKRPTIPQQTTFTIENGARHEYTPEFVALAKDYYLKL